MKVAIIGAGNMGGAIARGLAQGTIIPASDVTVADPFSGSLETLQADYPEINVTTENPKAIKDADIVILAVGIFHLFLHLNEWIYYVIGFVSVGLFLLLCALLFRAVTGKSGLGLGDVELMACAGLCIGWGHGLFAIIIGSVLGVLVEGIKMGVTKKKGKFPFGPYLSVGILTAVLFGERIYDWYTGWITGL